MSNLTASLKHPLQIAEGLQVIIRSSSRIELRLNATQVDAEPQVLEILHAFSSPTLASDAISRIAPSGAGAHRWMELTGGIVRLVRQGMLVSSAQASSQPTFAAKPRGFDSAPIHIAMLDDHPRTRMFIDAIAEVVRPGDVVVDLGTGTGVLAVAAAKAGASRVYAIEETGIANLARQVFEANGVADRIHLMEGHSTRISLPERADVLVSEVIGNDPLGEHVLESMGDAVARWMKPDARFIPQRLCVHAAPAQMSDEWLARWVVSDAAVQRWMRHYGVNFAPLATASCRSRFSTFVSPAEAATWQLLAEPQLAFEYSLAAKMHARKSVDLDFEVTRSGRCGGAVFWFELELSDALTMTTDPRQYRSDNHWSNPVWCIGEANQESIGNRIRVTLNDHTALTMTSMDSTPE